MPKKKKKGKEEKKLLDEGVSSPKGKSKSTPLLPLIGELTAGSVSGVILFTIFLTLKMSRVVSWSYWWILSPLWIILFILLILTQWKRISYHLPAISRIVWLICLISLVGFLILLTLNLENILEVSFVLMFLPLWILILASFLLGISGVVIGIRLNADDSKRAKYLLAGIAMLGFDAICFPFLLLLEFKLSGSSFGWVSVFIPLWVVDGFFLCSSFILLLFTIGSRDSAIFSLSQVLTFIFTFISVAIFKVLLALHLDLISPMSYYWIMTPVIVAELLIVSVSLNIRFTRKQQQQQLPM